MIFVVPYDNVKGDVHLCTVKMKVSLIEYFLDHLNKRPVISRILVWEVVAKEPLNNDDTALSCPSDLFY